MNLLTTILFIGAAADNQGWLSVQHSRSLNYDLETYPLEIKTISATGSGEQVYLYFHNSDGWSSGVFIRFTSPPQYYLLFCTDSWNYFPTTLPTATDKVWRITFTTTSGSRLQIHCNGIEVLNILLSDSICNDGDWRYFWTSNVGYIWFDFSAGIAPYVYRRYDYYITRNNLKKPFK